MNEPTGYAAVLIALITAGVTLWTQRGGDRARRKSAELDERAQALDEFKVLREAALQDVESLRTEVAGLRLEVTSARAEARNNARVLHAAAEHIRELRPMVPDPPGPPSVPELLVQHDIDV